jgi:hypothetical protein
VQFIFKATESTSAADGDRQPPADPLVADAVREIRHMLISDGVRQGMDRHQVQLVEVDGMLAVRVQRAISPVRGATRWKYS